MAMTNLIYLLILEDILYYFPLHLMTSCEIDSYLHLHYISLHCSPAVRR